MLEKLSQESAIGAASALTIWILIILYFCFVGGRRSNADEAILEMLKEAVKEAQEEKKLADSFSNRRRPELHRTIISRDENVTMVSAKMFGRWETAVKENWDELDLERW